MNIQYRTLFNQKLYAYTKTHKDLAAPILDQDQKANVY